MPTHPMKITIPESLKADVPSNLWGKIFAATPIVMTVIATMLAGLSTSEMTRAQYDRSLAAQQQSKAGDQWAYFQAKRLRETVHGDTLLLLDLRDNPQRLPGDAELRSLAPTDWSGATAWVKSFDQLIGSPDGAAAVDALRTGEPRRLTAVPLDPRLAKAIEAVEQSRSESAISDILVPVPDRVIDAALEAARDHVRKADGVSKAEGRTIAQLGHLIAQLPPSASARAASAAFAAADLKYLSAHYAIEAADNQRIALLLELEVRKGNFSAERHHRRSEQFFMGMLAAQVAVIVATFAMAARNKSLLWGIAAAAGAIAMILSIYVYLYV
ncbi:hypothetical protein GALL_105140 [mine drainage metagenome]|uniref:DUF4337 domain-containing protein n=1 Tax=mine drainage metagenome TaxID=410659 RepID=A0A1J5SFY1_9ZZZZ